MLIRQIQRQVKQDNFRRWRLVLGGKGTWPDGYLQRFDWTYTPALHTTAARHLSGCRGT